MGLHESAQEVVAGAHIHDSHPVGATDCTDRGLGSGALHLRPVLERNRALRQSGEQACSGPRVSLPYARASTPERRGIACESTLYKLAKKGAPSPAHNRFLAWLNF